MCVIWRGKVVVTGDEETTVTKGPFTERPSKQGIIILFSDDPGFEGSLMT